MRTKNVQASLDQDDVWGVPENMVRRADQFLKQGDTLVSSANSWNLVGKCSWIPDLPWRATFGGFVSVLRAKPGTVNPRYLYRWFSSERIQTIARSFGQKTTNISNLNIDRCLALELPLPSLTEQQRIAKILDDADALRARRRAALAQLDTLTQAIFIEMFGDPSLNPKGWPRTTLGEIASFVGGGTPSRAVPEYFSGTICWATSKDMKHEYLDDTEEHVTERAINESAAKLVPAGTVLVVVKSKILAHSLPVSVTRVQTCFGQDLKGIVAGSSCTSAFLAASLRVGSPWLLKRARGINTEGLTLDHLREFPMLNVALPLQQTFARRAAAVDKLKAAHRASLAEMDALFAALQDRAFRGAL
jgi:type I restriction enzyme S subunit